MDKGLACYALCRCQKIGGANFAMEDKYEQLNDSLRQIVGIDFDYVQAKDEHRHFDPITAATAYAATLFVAFITGAATKIGEKTGKALLEKITGLLSREIPQGDIREENHRKLRESNK